MIPAVSTWIDIPTGFNFLTLIVCADVLRAGGNAADAAVAMEAVLNVTLPMSTGIGGDAFCLFYGAQMRQVHAINGRYVLHIIAYYRSCLETHVAALSNKYTITFQASK